MSRLALRERGKFINLIIHLKFKIVNLKLPRMTLKTRRILSFIFILIFLAITPAVILYAAGYKLGRNGFSIQRTGMFIIDSRPKGAKIFIGGRVQTTFYSSLFNADNFITTPAKIKNILPGEYDVSLELSGYWSWRKKLTVSPGASTFAEDIYLFKNDLPVQIISAKIPNINFSPDKTLALIISADRLTFFNLADGTKKIIEQKNIKGKNISWSENNDKIIIDGVLYDLNDLSVKTDLIKLLPGSYDYKWSGGALSGRDKNSIYRLDALNQPQKIISNKLFNDYLIKNNYLYLIIKTKPAPILEVINLSTGESVKNISLPEAADYNFINQGHNLINLFDKNRGTLYLLDPLTTKYSPIVETINNVKTAYWTNDNELIYFNDFEIWLYNLNNKEKTLITRISSTINNAVIHPSKNYLIYSTARNINVIELDQRGNRNITELAKFDAIGKMALNSKGDILYFSGKIGNSEGLYKFLIQ